MRERGSALFTAMVAVMVLLLISSIFFATIINQIKTETSEERGLKAYYLAEAGLSAGAAAVLNRPAEYFSPNPPSPPTGPNPLWPNYGGGSFEVRIQIQPPNMFIVTSTGYYPDKNSPSTTRRKISAQYTLP
ncbi:MAG: hypothetical protein ACYCVD_14925 [Desulfitobacteriaceae bacterium]